MKNYPTSSSMFSLSSSPLFHTSGTATTATATATATSFDSSPSTLNNASSLSMMSKKNYAIPSSSSMILPLSLSSPIFPTSKNTIAISNCTAIATAIAIATETTATDDSDSDTATDDSNTDTDNDDSPALPEPSLLHQQQHRDQHQDQDQQQRKKSRSVHFLSMVAVRKTISRHEMTQEEKYNCWFQANEYLMIKQNNYDTIITNDQQQLLLLAAADAAGQGSSQQQQQQQHSNILHNSNNNDNMDSESESSSSLESSSSSSLESSLCMRGLEWGIESESIRKKTYRLGALEEVFIEQEEQYLGDYYNDEAIAYAYYSVSNECQLHAERIAIQDRKDIEEYIYEGLYETI